MLPHLVAWVDGQGFDGTSIRRLPGLADLTDPDLRVPEASVETAWRLATTMTGDAAIGVHVAESLPRGALDLVEYAFRSSAIAGGGTRAFGSLWPCAQRSRRRADGGPW